MPVSLLSPIAKDLRLTEGKPGRPSLPAHWRPCHQPGRLKVIGGIDRRRVLLFQTMLMILSGAIVAFAPNFPVMLVGRVLVGVALGGFWSLSAATAMRLVPGPCQRRSPWSILVPRWPRRSQPLLAALSAAFWAGAGLSSPSSAGRCSTGMDGNLASLASGPATQGCGQHDRPSAQARGSPRLPGRPPLFRRHILAVHIPPSLGR
jgi:MFS family permease